MFRLICIAGVVIFVGIAGIRDDELMKAPTVPDDTLPEKLISGERPNGFSALPESPDDNPISEAKVALGRKLFFDPILSKDNTVACASCHRPEHGLANSEKIAIGIEGKRGTRNVPTVFNRGYGEHFSWDGKAKSLEEQVLTPITNPNELGNKVEDVIASLRKNPEYVKQFSEAFNPDSDASKDSINSTNLAKAIAAFERVLIYADTRVDRFRGSDYTALSREARQGLWIFESRGGCWKCHGGENFTDEEFHNTGVGFGQNGRDGGRFDLTKNKDDLFKFKTPTLRGVEFTAPYMHDGSIATLKEVVKFYNRGGSKDDPELDADMEPLNLSDEEVGFLVEFLKALSK